ncbi:MAG: Hpt domain-containing protein, partial [Halobacteriovoraceae bacterium]|nr:Hpt domain-containing protein [Halobacteriovoraceae bacterium]
IEDYKAQFSDLFSTLKASVESQDGKQLKISAHTLKGIVSNFYAEDFKEAAFKLEMAGENNDFTETRDELLKFEKLNEEVILELEEFVKSFNAGTYQAA